VLNPWWAGHEVHSTHGAPPAAFARPTAAHGATARRRASWPEILSDGSDLRELSYLLRAENNRPREHAVRKQDPDARRLFADRPCASACRASRTSLERSLSMLHLHDAARPAAPSRFTG